MMLSLWNGVGSLILRCIVRDSTRTDNGGKTGLDYNTPNLNIAVIADNESTTTAYSSGGGTIEDITTLGTFQTPTSGKCRFKKVDDSNHPGLVEMHFSNARWGVSGARYVILTISGPTGATQENYLVQLPTVNLADATNSASPAVPNAAAGAVGGLPLSFATGGYVELDTAYDFAKGTVAMTEDYAADGDAPTPEQMLYMIWSLLAERAVSGTTLTAKKLDGTTTSMTFTTNSATAPTTQTRSS